MSIKRISRAFALAATMCILCVTLASCGAGTPQKTPAEENRAYMASVNSISSEAADSLSSFGEAASKGDVAAMRLAAADASKKLEKIDSLNAPEALAQVHEEYKAGVSNLGSALSGYIEAYAALQNQPEDQRDSAAFEAQIAEVQATYDTAVAHLSEADAMVAELASVDEAPAGFLQGAGEQGQDADSASDAQGQDEGAQQQESQE